MAEQYFCKDDDSYKRNINPIKHYIEQCAFYISKETNKPLEECMELVKKGLNDREAFPDVSNPIVRHFQKLPNGDKTIREVNLTTYIKEIIADKNVLAPSFTAYKNQDITKSVISQFAMRNVAMRSKVKKEMFKAKAAGDKEKALSLDLAQKSFKLANNALSGAFVSNGSVIKNTSAHSSLTSTTRTVTSLGNSSNERFITGNRHYRNPDIVFFNILSICSTIDKEAIRNCMEKYNLKYPTVDDVLACIERSSRYYWNDRSWTERIRDLLTKLDKEELAGFMYTGDIYHLRVINEDFIREYLDKLSLSKEATDSLEVLQEEADKYDDACMIFSRLINYDLLKGNKNTKAKDIEEPILRRVIGTCRNIESTLEEYKDLISTFFITNNVPPSVAYILDMVRRSVVLSDTDSTCASYGEWVNWRYGEKSIDSKGIAFSASVMTLSTQAIAHTLALLSANIGTDKDNLHRLAMKNEFLWTIFCPANISKTYFASTIVQEGVIFPEYDLEFKGVQYKSANAPVIINNLIKDLMRYVISCMSDKGKYSIKDLLMKVYDIESTILNYIHNKDSRVIEFFPQLNIKDKVAYAEEPHRSNYVHHLIWSEIFEPKYGTIVPPPYRTIKIPLDIKNKTDIKNWLTSIEDQALADRIRNFMVKYKKQDIKLICLSIDYVRNNGIPKEIVQIISQERLLNNVLNGVYVLLESLGYVKMPGQPYVASAVFDK